MPTKRTDEVQGKKIRIKTTCGTLFVSVGYVDGKIIEVFPQMGKSGSCGNSMLEAVGRLISISLQEGISVEDIIKQLRNIRCPEQTKEFYSCIDAVARIIEREAGHGSKV